VTGIIESWIEFDPLREAAVIPIKIAYNPFLLEQANRACTTRIESREAFKERAVLLKQAEVAKQAWLAAARAEKTCFQTARSSIRRAVRLVRRQDPTASGFLERTKDLGSCLFSLPVVAQ
jgi:hypothetical protein